MGGCSPVGAVEVDLPLDLEVVIPLEIHVVKGPFFPRVVNPRYQFHGIMCNARIQSSKARKVIF
jgi:hypothetical protein